MIEPKAQEVWKKYFEGLENADIEELAIRRKVSRLSYSHRCAEASAVRAYQKRGIALSPGMEISYVIKDAGKWEVDQARAASRFDAEYYGKLIEKAWEEVIFIFKSIKSFEE